MTVSHKMHVIFSIFHRSTVWLQNIGRTDLIIRRSQRTKVCGLHFSNDQLMKSVNDPVRLRRDAIPTELLPGNNSLPNKNIMNMILNKSFVYSVCQRQLGNGC